ncbi:uncharacterized protein LOC110724450 [Chenopodium quinoa]|uniref:uncharacterized protein LOC110724450 n=1 Tax=Chenopodium quinoa TaxID=63459 RepID=UPI000B76BFCA|nr:uncharacterized protein LOC110724450 [Chenopodium quinoa]
MPRDKAMEKLLATKKLAAVSTAKYRTNVLNRANDEQKAAENPKSGSFRPSPSKQSQPKIQKTGAGDVSASDKHRKHIAQKSKRGDGSTLKAGKEAMLRVQGLKRPIQEKSKEVTAANARADSALDRAQFEIAQNELLTLDMMYSQADANLQVKKDLHLARSKVNELKAEVKGLKEKLEPLQEAKNEAERAKERANEEYNAELLRRAEEEDADGEEADSSSGSSGDEDGEEDVDDNEEQPATDDAAANAGNPPAP